MQTRLRAIGDRDHPARLSLAPFSQLLPDGRLVPIVPRRLDEKPPRVAVACFRDRSTSVAITGRILARYQTEVRHELASRMETAEVVKLRHHAHRRHRVD